MHIEKAEILANHTISSRNGKTPIIDIKNKSVNEVFDGIEKVEVLFFENKIVIKVAKCEKRREEALGKLDDKTVFEIFAGGSTLTHTFKMAGFKSCGALELKDEYLALYHTNNPDEDVFTITANIEDIDPADYPKNVTCLLVGIPCTSYSNSNLHLKEKMKHNEAEVLKEKYQAEALTYYVLEAIRNIKSPYVVFEEVEEFTKEGSVTGGAYNMLKTVLATMGYKLSETVTTGTVANRKRWAMVATLADEAVSLDELVPKTDVAVRELLEISPEEREWKTADEHKRVSAMIRKNLGIRAVHLDDKRVNTFTTNPTRHTNPVLAMERNGVMVYSDFTAEEVRNIHGLEGYELSGIKTLDWRVLGQGVTDQFYLIAKRVDASIRSFAKRKTMQAGNGLSGGIGVVA